MPWDPFLMKILLKNRFVGPMNSAQDPLESTETCFSIKKKKKRETLDVDCTVAAGPTYENAKSQNAGIKTLSKRILIKVFV